eukprot:tig00021521_g22075.t1
MCEAAIALFVAWLASDAPAARAHPAAPFATLFFLGQGRGREPEPEPAPAPAAAAGAAELLEAAARVCARWGDGAEGVVAFVEGLAHSVRSVRGGAGAGGGAGAAAAARERFLAVAALGGWAGFEASAPAPRRPRDCALGLLFAAFHTGPEAEAEAEGARGHVQLLGARGRELPGAASGRRALLAAAERCFGLYGDALGARIAREAARL